MSSSSARLLHGYDGVYNACITLLALATVAAALRFYVRLFMLKVRRPDDIAMLFCWMCLVTESAIIILLRKDIEIALSVGLSKPNDFAVHSILATVFYILTMVFLKVSLGLTFLTIFERAFDIQRIVTYIAVVPFAIWGIVYVFFTAFSCATLIPATGFATTCNLQHVYDGIGWSWSAYGCVGDVVLAVLSIQALWAATMPRTTKALACGLLLLGFVGVVASVVRLVYITQSGGAEQVMTNSASAALWTVIEAGLSTIAVCGFTLRPLFARCVAAWKGKTPSANESDSSAPMITTKHQSLPVGAGLEPWDTLEFATSHVKGDTGNLTTPEKVDHIV